MRHQKKHGMKLGTDASHTKAMKKSLVRALLTNDRIKTTLTRAKAIRPEVDKVVTWAKRGDLHARRLAIASVGDAELVRETFEKAAQGMWQDRNSGYTRIMKLGPRKGDNAEIAIIELVQEAVPGAKKATKPVAKVSKVAKKEEPKATEKSEAKTEAKNEVPQTEASKPAEKVEAPKAEANVETSKGEKAEAPKEEAKPAGKEAEKPAEKVEAPKAAAKEENPAEAPQAEVKTEDSKVEKPAEKTEEKAEAPKAEQTDKAEDKKDEEAK